MSTITNDTIERAILELYEAHLSLRDAVRALNGPATIPGIYSDNLDAIDGAYNWPVAQEQPEMCHNENYHRMRSQTRKIAMRIIERFLDRARGDMTQLDGDEVQQFVRALINEPLSNDDIPF